MKGNKMLIIIIVVLLVVVIAGGVGAYFYLKSAGEATPKGPTIDEVIANSVDVAEVTTNLKDDRFIKIAFKVELDNETAKEEFTKRDFQTKDIIISELSNMSADDFKGSEGKLKLSELLEKRLNKLMQEGKIKHVYITSFILQ